TTHVLKTQASRRDRENARTATRIDNTRRGRLILRPGDESLTTEPRSLVIARAKRESGIQPDGNVSLRQTRLLALPHGHPMQPATAPCLEVRLVAVAPVGVRQRPNVRRFTAVRQLWLQALPRGTCVRFASKDAHHPGLPHDHVLQQTPAVVTDLEQQLINHVGRLIGHPCLYLEEVHGQAMSPSASSSPRRRFMHCTAEPAAPFPRLSRRTMTSACCSCPNTSRSTRFVPLQPCPSCCPASSAAA